MFKVHPSGAGDIMTNPRSKSELLSVTCKKYIQRQWISDKFNRDKEFTSNAIKKGLANEEQGITMLSVHLNEMLQKNDRIFQNDYLIGTPDVITDEVVYDIKCSYDIFTYVASDGTDSDYEWQLQCYMDLLGLKKASLVYVLTDTPPQIIQAELKSILWKLQDDDDALDIEQGLIKQMTYPDIPKEQRIKIFNFEYDPAKIQSLKERVELCRGYYDSLSL